MEKYILLTLLVSAVIVACSARVIDQVNQEDEAASISNAELESIFGSSLANFAALAAENDKSSPVLSRQRRDFFKMLAFLSVLQNFSGTGNGKQEKQNKLLFILNCVPSFYYYFNLKEVITRQQITTRQQAEQILMQVVVADMETVRIKIYLRKN